MSDRLEIKLTEINENYVSLQSMSSAALDSFVIVLSNLQSLVKDVVGTENLTFAIKDGSAAAAAMAPNINLVYHKIDEAVRGESDDKEFTKSLRKIQEQIKNEKLKYQFNYYSTSGDYNIHERLYNSNRISVKRSKYQYFYKVEILGGFLNEIGGKIPNYHFDYGDGEKVTINCSEYDAKSVKDFLYEPIQVLVTRKKNNTDNNVEYEHKAILKSEEEASLLRTYLNNYNEESNLISKLTLTHRFIDHLFSKNKDGHHFLKLLLKSFNDEHFHLSELKTLLVISKPFKNHDSLKNERQSLLSTYLKKKSR
jgi:hypothetical protein